MVELVVTAAEADEIRRLALATVQPMENVVDLDVADRAARHPASLIPVLDHPPHPARNGAPATSEAEWDVVALPHREQRGVTQQEVADRFGEHHAVRELHRP